MGQRLVPEGRRAAAEEREHQHEHDERADTHHRRAARRDRCDGRWRRGDDHRRWHRRHWRGGELGRALRGSREGDAARVRGEDEHRSRGRRARRCRALQRGIVVRRCRRRTLQRRRLGRHRRSRHRHVGLRLRREGGARTRFGRLRGHVVIQVRERTFTGKEHRREPSARRLGHATSSRKSHRPNGGQRRRRDVSVAARRPRRA